MVSAIMNPPNTRAILCILPEDKNNYREVKKQDGGPEPKEYTKVRI